MFPKIAFCAVLLELSVALAFPAGFGWIAAVSNAVALNWYNPTLSEGLQAPHDTAGFYNCKGPKISNYPTLSEWISFNEMWRINLPVLQVANPTYSQYIPTIQEKIIKISKESKVDARLILAVIMQESTGKLDVPCTFWSTTNCGIMQAAGGSISFNPADAANSIEQMIRDGVEGTASGPGLVGYLNGGGIVSWIQHTSLGNPYLAVHLYNAGSVTGGDNLGVVEGVNKKSKVYASDISSRLTGWDGGHAGCLASAQCPGQLREASECR